MMIEQTPRRQAGLNDILLYFHSEEESPPPRLMNMIFKNSNKCVVVMGPIRLPQNGTMRIISTGFGLRFGRPKHGHGFPHGPINTL
jgi:hypothetical protein